MPTQPRKKNGQFGRKNIVPPTQLPVLPPKPAKKAGNPVERFFDIHRIKLVFNMVVEEDYTRQRAAEIVSTMNDNDVYRHLKRFENK